MTTMSSRAEHYLEAEKLLAQAETPGVFYTLAMRQATINTALVHATLATASTAVEDEAVNLEDREP